MSDKPQKVKIGLDSPKLRISAPCPTAKGKYSTLSFGLWMNNPRLIVSTNDPALIASTRHGKIQAALDMPTMFCFIEMLKDAVKSKEAIKSKIETYGMSSNKDDKSPVHLTDVWVGRDDSGSVFVSVISKQEGWPVIKFIFGPSDGRFQKFVHSNGTEYSKAEASNRYANSYISLLTNCFSHLVISHYVEPPPFIPGNKGGYGGGNKPAYQNNQYQSKQNDIPDDDIPF